MITLCFFFNDTATTEIYTLSLHDALPIYACIEPVLNFDQAFNHEPQIKAREMIVEVDAGVKKVRQFAMPIKFSERSEEHTSELQSRQYLVCRLLLEKKKN